MKNIRLTPVLIPTEEASLLTIINCTKELILTDVRLVPKTPTLNQHLYLCSTLPIKKGEWKYCSFTNSVTKYDPLAIISGTGRCEDCKRIEFTTDPKLIADGVPAIDGNTKAIVYKNFQSSKGWIKKEVEVNFLEEYCKRYNQKNNQKDGYDDWMKMAENNQKGVDVEKLAKKFCGIKESVDMSDSDEAYYNSKYREFESYMAGYNQALQSNAGGFSLEDMEKCFDEGFSNGSEFAINGKENAKDFQDYTQSLTKESQSKEDIVIECEMENKQVFSHHSQDLVKIPVYKDNWKPKIKDGQPILIFK